MPCSLCTGPRFSSATVSLTGKLTDKPDEIVVVIFPAVNDHLKFPLMRSREIPPPGREWTQWGPIQRSDRLPIVVARAVYEGDFFSKLAASVDFALTRPAVSCSRSR